MGHGGVVGHGRLNECCRFAHAGELGQEEKRAGAREEGSQNLHVTVSLKV